jgi:hypothetical protein
MTALIADLGGFAEEITAAHVQAALDSLGVN